MSCPRNNQAPKTVCRPQWIQWPLISLEWTSSRPLVLFSMLVFQMMSSRALTVLRQSQKPRTCQWTMKKRNSPELLSYLQARWMLRRRRKSWIHNVRQPASCSEAGATPNGIHLAATRDSTRKMLSFRVPSCLERSLMDRQSTILTLRNSKAKPSIISVHDVSQRNFLRERP